MAFALIQFKPEFLDQLGLPHLPLPVRVDRTAARLQEGQIAVGELLAELLLWLAETPAEKERYRPVLARLGYLAGVNAGNAKDPISAIGFFRISLDADPNDLTVTRNYGLALGQSGQLAEAVAVYERLIAHVEKEAFSPEVWQEAVQLHYRCGNHRRALELVEQAMARAPNMFTDGPEVVEQLRKHIAEAGPDTQGGKT